MMASRQHALPDLCARDRVGVRDSFRLSGSKQHFVNGALLPPEDRKGRAGHRLQPLYLQGQDKLALRSLALLTTAPNQAHIISCPIGIPQGLPNRGTGGGALPIVLVVSDRCSLLLAAAQPLCRCIFAEELRHS